ncbi:IS256 family transposase [Streptomyces sp. NPDC059688]|uniref:IS256 family transposase n=1 Tax=Streptomyces sp. NPDC059688 TaxID=3346906 RepID=UPI0036883F7F
MVSVVNDYGTTANGSSLIDQIVREGARRMLAAALEAEVDAYIAELADRRGENGRRLVVRNGYHQPRKVTTAAGAVEMKAPRVNDKRVDAETGERRRFSSAILPSWCRKSPKISEVLPLLYLHGLSSGDFVPALEQILSSAAGLSPARGHAPDPAVAGRPRRLHGPRPVRGRLRRHPPQRPPGGGQSLRLVLVGVRADGSKELVALKDGYRQSGESWADLLRGCGRRGMRAPVLAVGDGALGFWKALAEVFPEIREQRCWIHKPANVLDSMPKSAQPGAKKATQDIYNAEGKQHAEAAIKTFAQLYGAKFPKAVKKITDDQEQLLAFYDLFAEHCIHLRTTNPIESTFSTVRLRTKVTRGAGSRTAALAMVFKFVDSAQQRWRAVNAPHLVALVRAGARFERGHLAERPEAHAA